MGARRAKRGRPSPCLSALHPVYHEFCWRRVAYHHKDEHAQALQDKGIAIRCRSPFSEEEITMSRLQRAIEQIVFARNYLLGLLDRMLTGNKVARALPVTVMAR